MNAMGGLILFSSIFVFPLLSFLALLLPNFKFKRKYVSLIGVTGPVLSFGAVLIFTGLSIFQKQVFPIHISYWTWLPAFDMAIPFRFHIDPVTLILALVVSGVGSLIHIYSVGYMEHEKDIRRFFIGMNLFMFMMLLLISADNLPVLFIGWEGVGLCSYLLIAFWYERDRARRAGMKAFVVNRIGDAFFIVGMILLGLSARGWSWESFYDLSQRQSFDGFIAIALLFLFIGATGKSAQIPLYVWLPDAMEGPTPVSALIHAATMVTAGVYLVIRLGPLYDAFPGVRTVILVIGLATAFYGAVVALSQKEMKRVLAFSTISQLGYMFSALGVGAYVAGLFHLVTHAFFKALLFLTTGNVMHACGDEQDMRKLEGLHRVLPRTSRLFLIGSLSLAGFPLMAGFMSKDTILEHLHAFSLSAWMVAWITAGFTALYALKLYFSPFFGGEPSHPEAHELPQMMNRPLTLLAFLSIFGGVIGIPLQGWNLLEHVLPDFYKSPGEASALLFSWFSSFVIFLIGGGIAWFLYMKRKEMSLLQKNAFQTLDRLLERQVGWNELYHNILVRPFEWISHNLFNRWIEKRVIEDPLEQSVRTVQRISWRLVPFQNGNFVRYGLIFLMGVCAILGWFIYIYVRMM